MLRNRGNFAPTESPAFRNSSMKVSELSTTAASAEKRICPTVSQLWKRHLDGTKLTQIPADDDAVFLATIFERWLPPPRRTAVSRARIVPAAVVADAVFLPVGVIGVARTKGVDEIAVITAALIFVPDQEGNGSARGVALEHSERISTRSDSCRCVT